MDFDAIERAIADGRIAQDQHLRTALESEIIRESGVVVPSVLGLILGAIAFSQVGTLGAIAIALMVFEFVSKRLKRSGQMLRSYERGQLAPLLTPELQQRYNLPALPAPPTPPPLTQASDYGTMNPQGVGITTQLGAIAVHADPVAQIEQRVVTATDKAIDPAEFLVREQHSSAQPCTASAILCAAPRGGKGSTVQRLIARVKRFHPTAQVWAIDPKDDPEEYWYWEQCDRVYRCSAIAPDFDAKLHGEGITEFIKAFYKVEAKISILIIDECVTLKTKLDCWKWITDFVVAIASSGPSRGKFSWLLTQSPLNGDLGFTGGSKASLANLYLASNRSAETRNHMSSSLKSGFLSSIAPADLIDKTGFACHFNGRWYSVTKNEPVMQVLKTQMRAIADKIKPKEPTEPETKKPDIPFKQLYQFALELEEWINQHPNVEPKDYYSRWNAKRKGFSRPEFRYLLTLTE